MLTWSRVIGHHVAMPPIALAEKVETSYGTKVDYRARSDSFELLATDAVSIAVPGADPKPVDLVKGDSITVRTIPPLEPIRKSPMRNAEPKKPPYRDTDLRIIAKLEDPIEREVKQDLKRLASGQ